MKKNYLFLVLIALIIGACSDINMVLPKGDKGDPGERGLSAYEDWVGMVNKGVYPDWVNHTEKPDFMKFLSGSNGASAYDLWKDMISSGKITDPHNPNEIWKPERNDLTDFFEYLTGAKGDSGLPGSKVTINIKGNWEIDGVDTGVLARGKNGENGLSAYEIWVEKVLKGDMPDKKDPLVPWDSSKISLADFWDYFSGEAGVDGITPNIGKNKNWWINGKDTGIPAQGESGVDGFDGNSPEIGNNGNWWIGGVDTGKPSQGIGVPGASAYDLWKKEVLKGTLKNPHPEADGYVGEFWNTSKTSLYDFWFYLRGRDGKDGKDGDVEIVKGKPNLIAQYFNSKTKEYIDPKDGSATFIVYDKEGAKAPSGSVVRGLPGLTTDATFMTDVNGAIHVSREYLPDKKSLDEREGITLEVIINGESSKSAPNTVVPNRVNTRLTLQDVYLRSNSPWDWNRSTSVNDFTVLKFSYEREVDGIWILTDTYENDNRLAVVHIKDINKPVTIENIVEDFDVLITNPNHYLKWGSRRGEGGSPNNLTTPFFDINHGIYLVYRPIVLTNDESVFDISEGTRYPTDYRMDWILQQLETTRKYAWNGIEQYITVIGLENYYGEHPIMHAKVHNPEIYPSPSLKDVKYKKSNGSSALIGWFDEATIAPIYKDFFVEDNLWKAEKLNKVSAEDGPGFQISMTKFTAVESGSTELSVKATYDDLSFILGSAYPNNVLTTRVFSYWHLPEVGRLGDCNSFYRLRPIFDFYNKGTNESPQFVLKDIYGSKEYNVPVLE